MHLISGSAYSLVLVLS